MTKLYGVIGNPIEHSMSPLMHNDLFSFYGINAYYLPLLVTEDNLETAVKGLKAVGTAGFNVTVPHKQAILPLLDSVDPLAMKIGAVNTVVNENGKLVGYNTDGMGFIKGLEQILPTVRESSILILGAGGAARAIYFSLAHLAVKRVDIANRTLGNAQALIEQCPYPVISEAKSLKEAARVADEYHLIINTTSIGMFPRLEEQPISLTKIHPQAMISDIIYNPLETRLLKDAKLKGAAIQNGIDMFVYQGALAFEKWTGIFPDTDRMRQKVMNQLGGKHVNR